MVLESISGAYMTLEHANANTNANANASTNTNANEFELVVQNLMFLMEKVIAQISNTIFLLIDIGVSTT